MAKTYSPAEIAKRRAAEKDALLVLENARAELRTASPERHEAAHAVKVLAERKHEEAQKALVEAVQHPEPVK